MDSLPTRRQKPLYTIKDAKNRLPLLARTDYSDWVFAETI